MKKVIFCFTIISLFLLAGCVSVEEQQTEDWQSVAVEGINTEENTFLENVYLKSEICFFRDGFIKSYKTFTYDDDMKLIYNDFFDSFDKIQKSIVYGHVLEGKSRVLTYNSRGELVSWEKNIFNPKTKKIIRKESYDSNNELLNIYEYDYMKGQSTWIELKDAFDIMQEYTEFVYQDDKLIEEVVFNANKEVLKRTEYFYFDNNLSEKRILNSNGELLEKIKYYYGKDGLLEKKEVFAKDESLKNWFEYEYIM